MVSTLATLWWLCFWTALGLCIGSFLNSVIYRLPRNQSLRNPLWSACPHCRHRIRWHDNIPIISFIVLGGRSRRCGGAISTHYLVIEASMALIVLMLLDAFFIGQARAGLSRSPLGLTDRLWFDWDWPIFLAHVTLFACLLPMAVIDLEHYWVDVRFTNLATVVGVVLHALWTPRHSQAWIRPWDATAVVSLFCVVGLGIAWAWTVLRSDVETEPVDTGNESAPAIPAVELMPGWNPPPPSHAPSRGAAWVAALLLLGSFAALFVDASGLVDLRHAGRAMPPLVLFFALVVWEWTAPRDSDLHIIQAIEKERQSARRVAVSELGHLIPAILLGCLGWWVMNRVPGLEKQISHALHWKAATLSLSHWSPIYGLATAATGYIVAGAVGWSIRIVFTLLFGKEAFGSGDIHLMAAAGAVAGWPIVVLGFFLTCGLALIGWVAALPFKRTRAVPLGPWLCLSFLAVVVYYDAILRWPVIDRAIVTVRLLLLDQPRLLPLEDSP